jgi:hypothetical protein
MLYSKFAVFRLIARIHINIVRHVCETLVKDDNTNLLKITLMLFYTIDMNCKR